MCFCLHTLLRLAAAGRVMFLLSPSTVKFCCPFDDNICVEDGLVWLFMTLRSIHILDVGKPVMCLIFVYRLFIKMDNMRPKHLECVMILLSFVSLSL